MIPKLNLLILAMLKRKVTNPHDSQSKRHRSIKVNNETPVDGLLVMKNMDMKLLDSDKATAELNLTEHQLRFTSSVKIESSETVDEFFSNLKLDLEECFTDNAVEILTDTSLVVDSVLLKLHSKTLEEKPRSEKTVKDLLISWKFRDEKTGQSRARFLNTDVGC